MYHNELQYCRCLRRHCCQQALLAHAVRNRHGAQTPASIMYMCKPQLLRAMHSKYCQSESKCAEASLCFFLADGKRRRFGRDPALKILFNTSSREAD